MMLFATAAAIIPLALARSCYGILSAPKNPLNDHSGHHTGIKKVSQSKIFKLANVKALSRKLNVTINDLITNCIVNSFSKAFEQKDPNH